MPFAPEYEIDEKTMACSGYLKLYRYIVSYRAFGGGWLKRVSREVVANGEAVVVLPYDPKMDAIVVTEQFRIGAMAAGRNPWVLGLVAGMMHAGEVEEDVGRREGLEEINCKISRMKKIADFMPSPGISSEVVHVYAGEVDASGAGGIGGVADEKEDIRISVLSADEALRLFSEGRFISAASVVALQWLAANRAGLRREWGAA